MFKHLFGELHHPFVIFVRYIYLHYCELRVMSAVHTFISEVSGEFVHPFETAYNKPFKVKFICYAKI